MQPNRLFQSPSHSAKLDRLLGPLVTDLIEVYRPELDCKNISLESDLETVSATFNEPLIRTAIAGLLDNAIGSMPQGGELSITLIDGRYQWELEIADTHGMAFNPFETYSSDNGTQVEPDAAPRIPVIIPFPATESLRTAIRAAIAHGGQIQTWDCPQGGTAHVLVIPKCPRQLSRQAPSIFNQTPIARDRYPR